MSRSWAAVSAIFGALAVSGAARAQPAAGAAPPPISATMDDLAPEPSTTAPPAPPAPTASPTTPSAPAAASTAPPSQTAQSPTPPLAPPRSLVVQFGAGISWMLSAMASSDSPISMGEAMHFEMGYRLGEHIAIAGHVGIAFGHSVNSQWFADAAAATETDVADGSFWKKEYYSVFELGAALPIYFSDGLWATPWLGFSELKGIHLAVGGALGFDFLQGTAAKAGSRLGAFAKVLYVDGDPHESRASGLQFGLAYNYR